MSIVFLCGQGVQNSQTDARLSCCGQYTTFMMIFIVLHFISRSYIRILSFLKTGVPMSECYFHMRLRSFADHQPTCRELLLLEGISLQGLGNWQAVAEHVGTRTKEEVEQHYKAVYIDSQDWPLPVRPSRAANAYFTQSILHTANGPAL